ncbi:unnamed protein product [Rangifer tarandus platyrhynchus]|uniref:Uncharacterized protein n=1 Tax=Rangifer tarandus platyrhynchus TaxID=3082113 RepID=A0AC59Y884_RANTA
MVPSLAWSDLHPTSSQPKGPPHISVDVSPLPGSTPRVTPLLHPTDFTLSLFLVPLYAIYTSVGFPHNSVGKESVCNAGDPGLISGLGRSPGEGIGYPLQYSWASLVAQLVKNRPAIRETWVRSLCWEIQPFPGEGKGYPLQYSGLENYTDCVVHGVSKSRTRLNDFHFQACYFRCGLREASSLI